MIITPKHMTNQMVAIQKHGKPRRGVSTGFASLDEYMLLNKQYLFVLTGFPNMGKSAFLNALAVNTVMLHSWNWLYFSPENDALHTHLDKLIRVKAGKRVGHMNDMQLFTEIEWAQRHFAWIDPKDKFFSLDDVMAATEEYIKAGNKLDVMVVDPWNELCHSKQTGRDDVYISQELLKLRKFHRKHNLLSIIVIHPHSIMDKDKDGNYPIPHLRHCAGGAMWWNKTDYGLCVHRHDFTKHGADIYIQKIKDEDIGKKGKIYLDYQDGIGRFKDTTSANYCLPEVIPSFF